MTIANIQNDMKQNPCIMSLAMGGKLLSTRILTIIIKGIEIKVHSRSLANQNDFCMMLIEFLFVKRN